jgi:AcrR family transcriptional regulator
MARKDERVPRADPGGVSGIDDPDALWPPFGPDGARRRPGPDRGRGRARERAGAAPGWGPDSRGTRERAGAAPGRGTDRGGGRGWQGSRLSREEIVDAAIAIADADGAEAISMRRIAQVLRSGTMSLYWHVTSKEHLLDLMLDVIEAEVTVPDVTDGWRSYLQQRARSEREMLLRHRWVMDFIGGRPTLGPNTILGLERALTAIEGLGLDTATALNVLSTVGTYVMGAVLRELREARAQRDTERANLDEAEFAAGMADWRDRLAQTGSFPHFIRILDEAIDPDAEETRNDRFEFGLDCVLDGVAARVAASPGRDISAN